MNKPLILAKSKLSYDQMFVKLKLGADAIEVQLLDELVTGDGKYLSAEDAFPDIEKLMDFPVASVHAPLLYYTSLDSKLEPDIELYTMPQNVFLLEQVCKIADMFGRKQNKMITVVFHSEIGQTQMKDIFARIHKNVKHMLDMYQYIIFAFENVTPVRGIGNDGTFSFGNNFGFDNIWLVEQLRKSLPSQYSSRICTVLDVCHVDISYMISLKMAEMFPEINSDSYKLKNYFSKGKDTCGLIHFSRTRGNGRGKGKHGQPCIPGDKLDKFVTEHCIELYEKYDYACPIVLEVAETDYLKSDGFSNTLKVINEFL